MFQCIVTTPRAMRLAMIALAAIMSSVARAAPAYTILDLGTLGGDLSIGYGLNDAGQVAGVAWPSGNSDTAFRTAPGRGINAASDLGTLGGIRSKAWGINAAGQVVGDSNVASGFTHAFRTTANGKVGDPGADLGVLPGGGFSSASGINALGQVVGQGSAADATQSIRIHAFRTTPNGTLNAAADLGTLPGDLDSSASAVNALGQVVGDSFTSTGGNDIHHAFRTTATGTLSTATNLGDLGGIFVSSFAHAINASGQAVGQSGTADNSSFRAFRTTPNGTIDAASDLGTLPGAVRTVALSINDAGQVVGFSATSELVNATHAFFADVTGPMQDLNDLIPPDTGWVLNSAQAINDSGQIAGAGTIGGHTHAFLLTPVPEPGGPFLIAVSGAILLQRRSTRSFNQAKEIGHARRRTSLMAGFERDPVRYGAVDWRVLFTGESERFSPQSHPSRPLAALAPFSPPTLRETHRS